MAASFEIAGRALGPNASVSEAAVLEAVRSYREAMLEFAEPRDLEVGYARLPCEGLQAKIVSSGSRRDGRVSSRVPV